MIAYASRTGTKRNLDALRAAGWRLLVSATGEHRHEGFPYAIDNGAWTAHQKGLPFDCEAFEQILSEMGHGADWIVLPDIVMGGLESLAFSLEWLKRLRDTADLRNQTYLIAVQNGMEPADLGDLVGRKLGIFVGGDDQFKEGTMATWADLAHSRNAICHVGRVNTTRRISLCAAAGVDSFDGSSVSRFVKNLPKLDGARRQADLELLLRRPRGRVQE